MNLLRAVKDAEKAIWSAADKVYNTLIKFDIEKSSWYYFQGFLFVSNINDQVTIIIKNISIFFSVLINNQCSPHIETIQLI